MDYLPAVLALLIGAAGWFYLFYSQAAQKLGDVEQAAVNLRRIRLRRINGFILLLLAVIVLYVGSAGGDEKPSPMAFLLAVLGMLVLLAIVVWLALVDLRLTMRLRRERKY